MENRIGAVEEEASTSTGKYLMNPKSPP